MCCSWFLCKRNIAVASISCLAILVGISGICMMVFSFLLTNSEFIEKITKAKAFEDVDDARKMIFWALVIFSVVTILLAFCGCCFKCCWNRCFAWAYGIILTPVWILVVIFGGLAAGASVASGDTVEDTCKDLAAKLAFNVDEDGDFDLGSLGSAASGISSISAELGSVSGTLSLAEQLNYPAGIQIDAAALGLLEAETTAYVTSGELTISFNIYEEIYINQEMCTRNCPCKTSASQGEWNSLTDEDRTGYGRTK